MEAHFGKMLRILRTKQGLSQHQLANKLHVDRATISNWEADRRLPDVDTLSNLAKALGVDISVLLVSAKEVLEAPNILLVDDERITLNEWLTVLQEALPKANIATFTKPMQAVAYAEEHPVAIAFLDIELGRYSGLDICQKLLHIHPNTNVIYLTGYKDYSLDAWKTGACGFLLKPLTAQNVREQLSLLRHPVGGLM